MKIICNNKVEKFLTVAETAGCTDVHIEINNNISIAIYADGLIEVLDGGADKTYVIEQIGVNPVFRCGERRMFVKE